MILGRGELAGGGAGPHVFKEGDFRKVRHGDLLEIHQSPQLRHRLEVRLAGLGVLEVGRHGEVAPDEGIAGCLHLYSLGNRADLLEDDGNRGGSVDEELDRPDGNFNKPVCFGGKAVVAGNHLRQVVAAGRIAPGFTLDASSDIF
jgi:hypothetical protein